MKADYRICISSPPDREKLVAEIFFDDVQWAEINQEGEVLEAEFYPRPDGAPWRIVYQSAIEALQQGARRLVGNEKNGSNSPGSPVGWL